MVPVRAQGGAVQANAARRREKARASCLAQLQVRSRRKWTTRPVRGEAGGHVQDAGERKVGDLQQASPGSL